jgi:hypothetical protein
VASAPARKLLQGRLNTASSARQQYEALEVVAVAYMTNSSIFFSQVETLKLLPTCSSLAHVCSASAAQLVHTTF